MMTMKELEEKVAALQEWQALADEAAAMVEALKDELKAEMLARDVSELAVGTHILRYSPVISNRFDSTGFKKAFPDTYKAWTKPVTSRRFTISK